MTAERTHNTRSNAIATANPETMEEVRVLRAHGIGADPLASRAGWNAKMDELSATVALHSLARFDDILARRARYASVIRAAASAQGWTPQKIPEHWTRHAIVE